MNYKLGKTDPLNPVCKSVTRLLDGACIPYDPANTDYANFKKEVNAETAELQDAEGNTMTASEAKAYVATLP
jgi:hypothetical protein